MGTGKPHRASEDWVAVGAGLALFGWSLALGIGLLGLLLWISNAFFPATP